LTPKQHVIPQTNTFISYYYEIRGGGVYIRAGGTAVITGCLFTVNPVLITEFLLTSSPETTVRMCVRACVRACARSLLPPVCGRSVLGTSGALALPFTLT